MNRVLLGVLVLLVLGVGAIASILWTKDRPAAPAEAAASGTDARDDLDRLAREVAGISERLARLERSGELARSSSSPGRRSPSGRSV